MLVPALDGKSPSPARAQRLRAGKVAKVHGREWESEQNQKLPTLETTSTDHESSHRSMTTTQIAVAGPMDVRRLASELALAPASAQTVPAGRGGHSVTELILAMAEQVDRLDLVTLDHRLSQPVELQGDRVRLAVGVFRPKARDRSKDLFKTERSFIEEKLRLWQPDVVSAHWTYEYALGSLDSRIPSSITVRDWSPTILRHSRDAYRTVRLGMQALTFARGRNFVAASPYMAKKVHRVTRRPVTVLPNALGPEWFEDPPEPPQTPRIIAINNGFGRRKNVQRLLAAWPDVLRRYPKAELVLVGAGYGPDDAAHSWARKRRLSGGVSFLGPVERSLLPELLRSATAFAHPALEESFGMVVLEAMALGVPVLGGRRSGAVPWLLADDSGIIVDVRRPRAVSDGLLRLLDSPDLARETAQRARERAQQYFSVRSVATSYIDHLDNLASRSK